MRPKRHQFWLFLASLLTCVLLTHVALGKKDKHAFAGSEADPRKAALHALNRLTFGPRPGDVDRVLAMGVDKWIDQQLHPEQINDTALDSRLTPLRTLKMDTRQMVENFPPPQIIKAVAEGRQPMPRDSAKQAIYKAQIERYQQKKEAKQQAAADSSAARDPQKSPAQAELERGTPPNTMSDDERLRRRDERIAAKNKAQELMDLPPDQRMRRIFAMSPEEQQMLAQVLRGNDGEEFMQSMDAKQRETILALGNPQQVVSNELMQGKLLRAIYSERQLQEVMTDFWFNHFNVFVGKGADRYLLTSYERDVIRPHAMGKFEDLLLATAESPAMLFYLDNWLSVGPNSDFAMGVPKRPGNARRRQRFPRPNSTRQAKGKRGGLNENYGRELMELHTLGVSGGYTQEDVTEVARVFTGWTLKQPRQGGGFQFDQRMHEPGDKVVLGHRIKDKGEKEGREVLHILAHHPATAKFISTKLATRFVSDNPPPALVDRMTQTFLKKDGDIRAVLKTMLQSPEFWSPDAYRAKVKTPLEFVVSAVRATGAEVTNATPLVQQLQTMGMPLYGAQPPTGYSMKADAWVNSSALLGRMNFGLALASGKFKSLQIDSSSSTLAAPSGDPQQALSTLENTLLAGDISRQTHETILARVQDTKSGQPAPGVRNVSLAAGLLLGSPEFQRR